MSCQSRCTSAVDVFFSFVLKIIRSKGIRQEFNYLSRAFNDGLTHNAALPKSGCVFRSSVSKPEATVVKGKNSPRRTTRGRILEGAQTDECGRH